MPAPPTDLSLIDPSASPMLGGFGWMVWAALPAGHAALAASTASVVKSAR
jgi:hypothetical protein